MAGRIRILNMFVSMRSHDYARVCALSDSMSMIRNVEAGDVRRQWLAVIAGINDSQSPSSTSPGIIPVSREMKELMGE